MNYKLIVTVLTALLALPICAINCEEMLAELTQFADAAIRAQKNYQKVYSAETEEKYDAKMSLLYGKVDEVLAACPQYKVAIIAQLHRGCN